MGKENNVVIRDIKFVLVYEPMMKVWIQLTVLILTDSVLGHRTNQLEGNRTALEQVCYTYKGEGKNVVVDTHHAAENSGSFNVPARFVEARASCAQYTIHITHAHRR